MSFKLVKINKEPNSGLIKSLEECLEAAKSGKLRSFIAVGECADKTVWLTNQAEPGCNMFQMLGALDIQKHYILKECRLEFKKE